MSDDTFTVAESPERIWLSPQCEDERTWCQDQLDTCNECHSPAVEYIRLDLHRVVVAERDRLLAESEETECLQGEADKFAKEDQEQIAALKVERDRLDERLKSYQIADDMHQENYAILEQERDRLKAALEKALRYMEKTTCSHEDTHRGGFLWEICDDCGAKWADDQGGKPEYQEPAEITNARAALQGDGNE